METQLSSRCFSHTNDLPPCRHLLRAVEALKDTLYKLHCDGRDRTIIISAMKSEAEKALHALHSEKAWATPESGCRAAFFNLVQSLQEVSPGGPSFQIGIPQYCERYEPAASPNEMLYHIFALAEGDPDFWAPQWRSKGSPERVSDEIKLTKRFIQIKPIRTQEFDPA